MKVTDVVAAVDANYVHAFRCLATASLDGEHHVVRGLPVALTGAPRASFNVALVVQELSDPELAFREASLLASTHGLPLGIAIRSDLNTTTESVLANMDYRREAVLPAMALALDEVPAGPDLEVTEVLTPEDHETWASVNADAFQMPRTTVDQVFGPGLLDIEGYECYLAWKQGEPVATSSLVFDPQGTAGIYNVATLPDHRREGIGRELTVHALVRAASRGARLACLQAYSAGRGIYERLGFRDVCSYDCYGPSQA